MKTISILFSAIFLLALMFYIAGSWTSASFDLNKWSTECRGVCAAFWIILSFCSVPLLYLDDNQNEKR